MKKSSVEEIRRRFDADVERFSNLESGQTAAIDSPLALELITDAAAKTTPNATRLLDLGSGAGNYSIKQLEKLPNLEVTLVDLSQPMLTRAQERISPLTTGTVECLQGDLREIDLGNETFDIVLASAVLHHLRTKQEWEDVFQKIYNTLRPGGSFWIFDLVKSSSPEVQELMWKRYSDYLVSLNDTSYRDKVFQYIEIEDSPWPLMKQVNLLQETGFEQIEILHKNACFAAFGGSK